MVIAVASAALSVGLALPPLPASAMIATSLVRDVIHAAAPRFRQCLAEVPLAAPGRLTVSFTIAADGRVTEATVVRDDIGRPALAECVALVILDLRFPEFRHGSVRITYPFRFAPGE